MVQWSRRIHLAMQRTSVPSLVKEDPRCHGATKPMTTTTEGFPGGSTDKESAYNARNMGLIPGLGRSSGEGNGNPLQHACLGNPTDRGTWKATVHRVAKSQTRLSYYTTTVCYYTIGAGNNFNILA